MPAAGWGLAHPACSWPLLPRLLLVSDPEPLLSLVLPELALLVSLLLVSPLLLLLVSPQPPLLLPEPSFASRWLSPSAAAGPAAAESGRRQGKRNSMRSVTKA
jgi:hypothetical protein